MKVKDVANVCSGLIISRKKAIFPNESVNKYLQINLKCFNKNGFIEKKHLELLNSKGEIEKTYLTQEKDVVIRLTSPFTAVYIDKKDSGYIISSNFCVVRCSSMYNPAFLAHYLNSEISKKFFNSMIKGSIMKNINMSSIQELDIPNISLNKQEILAKLFTAQINKLKITEKITTLEEKRTNIIFSKLNEGGLK